MTTAPSVQPEFADAALAAAPSLDALSTMPFLDGAVTFGTPATDDRVDAALEGPEARGAFNVTGAGITIGILSDSFDVDGGEAADIADGDLPSAVNILKEGPSSGHDEGRAMAEIIHSIAPGATIDFYTAFDGESDFGAGITALAAAGARIIVDDVSYSDEPFYQDAGPITLAAEQAVADGVDYFSAAGNFSSNYYEAHFNAVDNVTLPGIATPQTVHEVQSGGSLTPYVQFTLAVGASTGIDMQWAQPFASSGGGTGSTYGLALAVYDASFNLVGVLSSSDPIGADPVLNGTLTNNTASSTLYMVVIEDAGTAAPGLFKVLFDTSTPITGPLLGVGSGTIVGHEDGIGVNAVGAINVANTPSGAPEYFTASGPGEILYNTAGALLTKPVVPGGPAFLAPDGSDTSVFAPFDGTSAAAPAAAAVAALMLQADPALNVAEVTAILEGTAIPDGGVSHNIAGAGLIDADTAVGEAVAMTACFLTGTRILTDRGEVSVEALRVGDRLVTLAGERRPVRWIGHSHVTATADPLTLPIRICAGALAAGEPRRDLVVSPGHAMLVDGVLAHAGALVNGRSIVRDTTLAGAFTYWHLELDVHAVIFADGAPAESFLAGEAEIGFDNWHERVAVAVTELPYPRCKAARQVPRRIRERLAARAAGVAGELARAA